MTSHHITSQHNTTEHNRTQHKASQHNTSQPYTTAEPEIKHHRLSGGKTTSRGTPRDRFLVMASDGLFQDLDNSQVVNIVGDYLEHRRVAAIHRPGRPINTPVRSHALWCSVLRHPVCPVWLPAMRASCVWYVRLSDRVL